MKEDSARILKLNMAFSVLVRILNPVGGVFSNDSQSAGDARSGRVPAPASSPVRRSTTRRHRFAPRARCNSFEGRGSIIAPSGMTPGGGSSTKPSRSQASAHPNWTLSYSGVLSISIIGLAARSYP